MISLCVLHCIIHIVKIKTDNQATNNHLLAKVDMIFIIANVTMDILNYTHVRCSTTVAHKHIQVLILGI